MRNLDSSAHLNVVLGYGVAVVVWLLTAFVFSPMAGLHLGLSALALALIIPRMTRLNQERDWPRLVAEWVMPLMLWITFGLGSIVTFLRLERMIFYGHYEDAAVQSFGFYVFLGAVGYVFCFRLAYTATARQGTWVDPNRRVRTDTTAYLSRLIPFVAVLLCFDWYVRLDQIRHGVYFTWLLQFGSESVHRETNLLYHLHGTLSWILLASLVYLAYESKKGRTLFGGLVAFQVLLVSLTGSRRQFLLAVAISTLSYLYLSDKRITKKLAISMVAAVVLFFGLVSPSVEAARIMMRHEGRTLARDPVAIPVLFLIHYLPGAMGFGEQRSFDREWQTRQGVLARMGGHMAYAASINQKLTERRRPLRGWDEFELRLTAVIPRVLYAGKKDVTAAADLMLHYQIGRRGLDPNAGHVVDVFSFLHAPGIILLLGIGGAFYGLATRFLLLRFGKLGGLIIIGSIPVFLPYANSFTDYLTGMRNTIIVIVVVSAALFGKERWRESPRTTPSRLPGRGLPHGGPSSPPAGPQAEKTW